MEFSASGKLLITAEYSVLRGALALSVPTKFGQKLRVEPISENILAWKSLDQLGQVWFEARFNSDFSIATCTDKKAALHMLNLLQEAKKLNTQFSPMGTSATTTLAFNPLWGLGSSSTLVALIAQWAEVDALDLFFRTSVGSGYDVATAVANKAILYTLNNGKATFKPVDFNPPFKKHLYFLYLDKKQRSAAEVTNFAKKEISANAVEKITSLTYEIVACEGVTRFEELLMQHEEITAAMLGYPTIKAQLFADFNGTVKSLGAWGGDFVLVVSASNPAKYFSKRGFNTLLSWEDMLGI